MRNFARMALLVSGAFAASVGMNVARADEIVLGRNNNLPEALFCIDDGVADSVVDVAADVGSEGATGMLAAYLKAGVCFEFDATEHWNPNILIPFTAHEVTYSRQIEQHPVRVISVTFEKSRDPAKVFYLVSPLAVRDPGFAHRY